MPAAEDAEASLNRRFEESKRTVALRAEELAQQQQPLMAPIAEIDEIIRAELHGLVASESAKVVPTPERWWLRSWHVFLLVIVIGVAVGLLVSPDPDSMTSGVIGLVTAGVALGGAYIVGAVNADTQTRINSIDSIRAPIVNQLLDAGAWAAEERIKARRAESRSAAPLSGGSASERGPAPDRHPLGVSHQGAEQLCAQWIAYLGAEQVVTTRLSQDGGIDAESPAYIAQVKHYAGTVGVESIRELAGVASIDGRRPLFFTSAGYTVEAMTFADRVAMPLFVYSAEEGELRASNSAAAQVVEQGL